MLGKANLHEQRRYLNFNILIGCSKSSAAGKQAATGHCERAERRTKFIQTWP